MDDNTRTVLIWFGTWAAVIPSRTRGVALAGMAVLISRAARSHLDHALRTATRNAERSHASHRSRLTALETDRRTLLETIESHYDVIRRRCDAGDREIAKLRAAVFGSQPEERL